MMGNSSNFSKVYGGVRTNGVDRRENDYYPTAPVATYALLRTDADRLIGNRILEPAAGRGWMAREMKRCGYHVIARDKFVYPSAFVEVEQRDFLEPEKPTVARNVITNPPYKNDLAQRFVERALDDGYSYVAMLVRLTWMESKTRLGLFRDRPPSRIYPFSGRFNCDEAMLGDGKQLGGMIAFAWFVWDYYAPLRTTVDWIDTEEMYGRWMNETGGSWDKVSEHRRGADRASQDGDR